MSLSRAGEGLKQTVVTGSSLAALGVMFLLQLWSNSHCSPAFAQGNHCGITRNFSIPRETSFTSWLTFHLPLVRVKCFFLEQDGGTVACPRLPELL